MKYAFHPEARAEFLAAIDYYEECEPGLGADFAIEVRSTIKKILSFPHAWPVLEAAAAIDPENPPLTPAREARLKPVPHVKTLRRSLGLTQEEFSARYHIPLGTLRDWEQGRTQPDQPARAFLAVIARAPEEVANLLLK